LVCLKTLNIIKKLITDAGPQSWSIVIAYTNAAFHQTPYSKPINREFVTSIEHLRIELQPLEISAFFDLNAIWPDWRPYFSEWIKWTALDVLVELIPWDNRLYEPYSMKYYESPWAMVVSLGFLKAALTNLQKTVTANIFPVVLYSLLSFLYILRGEKDISYFYLISFLRNILEKELIELYSDSDWEDEIQELIIDWTDPIIRLLPPIKYKSKSESLKKEAEISFYHQEWAHEVNKILLNQKSENIYNLICRVFKTCLPTVYTLWTKLNHTNQRFKEDFLKWIQENTRYELNAEGQLILVHLNLDSNQVQHFEELTLNFPNTDQLNQIQLLNRSFIKKVVSNFQTFG
ncbi:MAG: hypothetical protein ACFFDT_35185, partial [Candidatus Hodarchaeota archaeon]